MWNIRYIHNVGLSGRKYGICISYDYKFHNFIGYYLNDVKYRLNKPATIWYSKFGKVLYEEYYIHGKRHRLDEPATIYYNMSGIESERFYVNNKCHRLNGPAVIWRDKSGKISSKQYVNNKRI